VGFHIHRPIDRSRFLIADVWLFFLALFFFSSSYVCIHIYFYVSVFTHPPKHTHTHTHNHIHVQFPFMCVRRISASSQKTPQS
jgi:hypothetical protein